MKDQILTFLPANYPWAENLHYFDTLGSTNDVLKQMARQGTPHGTAILAGHQTNGHGRMGRSFHSPEQNGIYLSLLIRPNCAPKELMHLTCATAVAMCDAVESAAHFRPQIKWTNDIVHGRRKLGGILTELGLTPKGMVDYAIIGVGLNCTQREFPQEIQNIAASLAMVTDQEISLPQVAAAMLASLHQMSETLLTGKSAMLSRYKVDCITLNQPVSILRGEEVRHAYALDLGDDGALLVRYEDGSSEFVSSGEVSVRGMYGYL